MDNQKIQEHVQTVREAIGKATPGPWEAMNGNGRDIFTLQGAPNRVGIVADNNDGWHIADTMCGPTNVNGEEYELSYAERYSNSYLIANSPTWHQQSIEIIEQQQTKIADLESYVSLFDQRGEVIERQLEKLEQQQREIDKQRALIEVLRQDNNLLESVVSENDKELSSLRGVLEQFVLDSVSPKEDTNG